MIGKTLGHYQISSQLGKGGMGEVWKARDCPMPGTQLPPALSRPAAQYEPGDAVSRRCFYEVPSLPD